MRRVIEITPQYDPKESTKHIHGAPQNGHFENAFRAHHKHRDHNNVRSSLVPPRGKYFWSAQADANPLSRISILDITVPYWKSNFLVFESTYTCPSDWTPLGRIVLNFARQKFPLACVFYVNRAGMTPFYEALTFCKWRRGDESLKRCVTADTTIIFRFKGVISFYQLK